MIRFIRCNLVTGIFTAISALLLPSPALASGSGGPAQKIVRVWFEGEYLMIIPEAPVSNPDGCTTTSYVLVPSSVPHRDWFIATALNAVATGQKVSFYLYGCGANNNSSSIPIAATMSIFAP